MSNEIGVTCEFCTYAWNPIVKNPKSCPRCKRRFDYKDAKAVLEALGKKFNYELVRGMPWQKH